MDGSTSLEASAQVENATASKCTHLLRGGRSARVMELSNVIRLSSNTLTIPMNQNILLNRHWR